MKISSNLASNLKVGISAVALAGTMALPASFEASTQDFEIGYALAETYGNGGNTISGMAVTSGMASLGGYAGAKYGATFGSLGGPVGAFAGGVVGFL